MKNLFHRFSVIDRAQNCDDIYNGGMRESGIYTLFLEGIDIDVVCQFDRRRKHNWLVSFDFHLDSL